MKSVIIGIHGLGNKPPEKLLRSWWLESIREGLVKAGLGRPDITFDLAYWADVIHPTPLDPFITDKDDPLFLDEHYTPGGLGKKGEGSSLMADVLEYIEGQVDRIFLNDDMSINFRNVTDKVINHFFSDLETYYVDNCRSAIDRDCSAREAIQHRLLSKLEQYRGYRILLIAHSMGSIVAYDVLSEMSGESPVNTFITIGSPLGFPVIVGRISAARKSRGLGILQPSVPECITERWLNISDIRDRIALDHTLADDYLENGRGLRVRDKYVYNDYEMNGGPNPHKSFGYLRTPEMVDVIAEFLEGGRGRIYKGYNYLVSRISSGLKAFSRAVTLGRK